MRGKAIIEVTLKATLFEEPNCGVELSFGHGRFEKYVRFECPPQKGHYIGADSRVHVESVHHTDDGLLVFATPHNHWCGPEGGQDYDTVKSAFNDDVDSLELAGWRPSEFEVDDSEIFQMDYEPMKHGGFKSQSCIRLEQKGQTSAFY